MGAPQQQHQQFRCPVAGPSGSQPREPIHTGGVLRCVYNRVPRGQGARAEQARVSLYVLLPGLPLLR